jgi:AcrR family transcriptional regulator
MAVQQRKERERAERHQLIIKAARDLAETEGWEAVTTRRLAERVEYSQPVLYSHFANKDAIVAAVAVEGIGDLAAHLRAARLAASDLSQALRAVCRAYLDFSIQHPALYQAMFVLPTDLAWGSEQSPPQLKAAFDEFVQCVPTEPGPRTMLAELVWSNLHGLAVFSQTGRIPSELQEDRLDLLVTLIAQAAERR